MAIKAHRLVFPEPNKSVLEEVELGEPGPRQVLFRTLCTAVSTGTELTIFSGDFPPQSAWARYGRFPFVPGYSACCVVEALGPGVEGLEVGQRVAGMTPHASHALVDASRVYATVPDGVSDEAAATVTLGQIAFAGLRRGRPELGESVVVYGLGVLGLLTVQYCRLSGARPVIGVDLYERRLEMAKQAGAHAVINGREDVPARVAELTGGRMADLLFEITGNPDIIESEFRVLRRFGRAVILSSPRGPSRFDFHDFCNSPSITILGAHTSSTPHQETIFSQWTYARHAELYLQLIAAEELKVQEFVTHVIPWREAEKVHPSLLEDRSEAAFVIIDWR